MTIQIWRLLVAPPPNVSSKNGGTNESGERFMSVGYSSEEFVQHQQKKNTLRKNRCFVVEKVVSFKERAERVGEHWCKKSRRVNRQFSFSSSKERRRTIRAHIAEVFCSKVVSAFSVQHFISMTTQDVLRDLPLLLNLHLVQIFLICSFYFSENSL